MKLSDYRNEDALDLLADLLGPVADIMTDDALRALASDEKKDKMKIATHILKNHKEHVVTILARINNTPREKFSATLPEMISQLLEIMNDKLFTDFFASQAQATNGASFGPAMATTEGTGEA